MKKYKLIREYPNSPKIGTFAKIEGFANSAYPYKTSCGHFCYTEDQIENYPEFWEPVVEKDYEILSLWNQGSEYPKLPDGNFGSRCCQISTSVMDRYPIYKIKRLSDGEIFTIGDKIQYYNITGQKEHVHTIDNITIYQNEILLNHDHGTWKSHGDFNKVQKVKQPLFTTEDGVDIFEGDEFYYVKFVQYNNTLGKPFEIVRGDYPSFEYEPQYEKYFSTKEKAEEFILMNKPCLSLKEIKETTTIKGLSLKKLENLIKQKLNNKN